MKINRIKMGRIMDLYDRIHDGPFLWPIYIIVDYDTNINLRTDNNRVVITTNKDYAYVMLVYGQRYTYEHIDDAVAKLKEIAIETQNYVRED